MATFNNIQEAEAALTKYIPAVREMTGKDITLERISSLMRALGDPQERLKIIHIAGTSGKTSTAYYAASLLQSAGHKVGLTVSPHVDSITERVQINSQPLSEAEFCQALGRFMEIIQDVTPEPSYFELLVGFAYWYFEQIGVDYAVIETGMGGLHDGTNIAQRADKVCVITDIGLDHTHILGTSLPEIAAQKAGIIQQGNSAFMYRQAAEVTEIFEDYARKQEARLTLLDQIELENTSRSANLKGLPLYQRRNWLLARAVSEFIAGRDGWTIDDEKVLDSLAVQVPGRMDEQQVGDKTIIMDGAHNEQKMLAFVTSFQRKYPGKVVPILLSLKQGKEYEAVLPLLKPICSQLVITTFNVLQDLPANSMDPEVLAEAAYEHGFANVQVISDPIDAYKAMTQLPQSTYVITGSFYLLSCVRPLIMQL